MVEELDFKDVAGPFDILGLFDVRLTGKRIAGRMVVGHDDAGGEGFEGALEDELLVKGHVIGSPYSNEQVADDVPLSVHIQGEAFLPPKLISRETLADKIVNRNLGIDYLGSRIVRDFFTDEFDLIDRHNVRF